MNARVRRWAGTWLTAASALAAGGLCAGSGCGGRTLQTCDDPAASASCACAAERRKLDGSCCAGWNRANGSACTKRPVTRPTELQNVGPAGARALAVAVDASGKIVLAGESVTSGVPSVFVAEEQAGDRSLTVHSPAAKLAGTSFTPTVAAGPGRYAAVAWKQATGSDTAAIHLSERSGDAWTDPSHPEEALSFEPRAFQPGMSTTPLGETLLVWNQWRAPVYGVMVASRSSAGVWTRPSSADEILSPDAYFSNSPVASAATNGDALITWFQASKSGPLMAYRSERSGVGGAFSRARDDDSLSPPLGDVGAQGPGGPKPAFGPRNEAAVAWLEDDGAGHVVPFLATREPGQAWSKPTSAGDSLGHLGVTCEAVTMAIGTRGSLALAWTEEEGNEVALLGLVRSPNGAWTSDPRAPRRLSSLGTKAESPIIVAGPDGSMLLGWLELDASGGSSLVLRRGWDGDDGVLEWDDVEVVASADRFADSMTLVIGPTGRAVLAWTETHAQRVQIATID